MPSFLRQSIRRFLIWPVLAGLLMLSCEKADQKPVELTGSALGTTYSIKVVGSAPDLFLPEVHAAIESILDDINDSMSVFYPDSEVSRFNGTTATDWQKVSSGLLQVIGEAIAISEASNGAFDITMGSLIELWGFGTTVTPHRVPSEEEIFSALRSSHYQNLQISLESSSIRKTIPALKLNLSAIAKGYAVDSVGRFLEQRGIDRYLVEIGGEIRAKGYKKNMEPWLVAVESPESYKRSVFKVIQLTDQSMATSGDYRNFFEVEGKRYSHTIRPDNGQPVENTIASVSVIHPSCMTADALSTALMSMGYELGSQFAKERGYAVFWILRTENGLVEVTSDAFDSNLFR